MSLSKRNPADKMTIALSGGDADVLRDWTESLSRSQAMMTETSGRGDIEFEIFREIENRLTRRCAELEAEVARNSKYRIDSEAVEKIRHLEAALRASQEESAVLRKICEADKLLTTLETEVEARNVREAARLKAEAERIAENSERVRRYAETLNKEKEWIRETAAKMEEEIRTAATLHPLRDYLLLTEKEVVRVEIELKRMPTSSPARAGLEEVFGQLVTQREFLRTVMEASAVEARERADRLNAIQGDARSAPVPPHPERKRSSSEA